MVKKVLKPSEKKQRAEYFQKTYQVSIERSCKTMDLSRSMWYYQSRRDDCKVIDKLSKLAKQLPTRKFDEYYWRIRQQGNKWNRKRILRIHRNMKLGLRRKHTRRLPKRVEEPLISPDQHLHTWSMDFMSDVLADKRKVRVLNVIDNYN